MGRHKSKVIPISRSSSSQPTLAESDPPSPSSSSVSGSRQSISFTYSSSSLSSLSRALVDSPRGKRSPELQISHCMIEASTAYSSSDDLLYSQVASDDLHSIFTAHDKKKPEKDEEKKVLLRVVRPSPKQFFSYMK